MPSPLYDMAMRINPQPQQPQPNQNFMQQLMQFGKNFSGDPQLMVQNLLRSGQMSQQQFQQYAKTANQILGRTI